MRTPETLNPEAFIAANREALEAGPKITVALDGIPEGHHAEAQPQAERAGDPPADSRLIDIIAVLEGKGVDLQHLMEMADGLARSRKEARQGLVSVAQSAENKFQYDELVFLLQQSLPDRLQAQKAARLFIDRAEEIM